MCVRCEPAPSVRPAARVPSRWRENRLAEHPITTCGKKQKGRFRFRTALVLLLTNTSQPGFPLGPETKHRRPELQCAAGFLWTGGFFGAAFTSNAPSFMVITNGLAT